MTDNMIVTVDGPSGTGKSTVSRLVARELGIPHLDTGAFYRAATLAAIRAGVDLGDQGAVAAVVLESRLTQSDDGSMFLDGDDISDEIRGPAVTASVSAVAANPLVRRALVDLQRSWIAAHENRGVVEGRDIGSVVFPDASHKIYLDASPLVRAARRAEQDGQDPEAVIDELARRDHLDSTRNSSPLTIPEGAVVVDTSTLTLEEVVDRVVAVVGTSG